MKAEIYYFTGTGNSLAVARSLARRIGARLASIPSVMGMDRIAVEAEGLGIVFPAYLAQLNGVPAIVDDFVAKLEGLESKYVFAVCTYGAFGPVNALPTLRNLGLALEARGGELTAGFSIKLPMNNLDYDHVPVPINRDHARMFAYCPGRVEAIARRVMGGRKTRAGFAKALLTRALAPMYRRLGEVVMARLRALAHEPPDSRLGHKELIRRTDESIRLRAECNGCGACARVCPARNIEMVDGRPRWLHRCEMCLACDEWCPRRAIRHWCKVEGKDYRHPEVTMADMLAQPRRATRGGAA